MYLYDILIAALLGGVIVWDRSSFLLLASEPLIICSAAGAYCGNLEQGVALGIWWQIIWMGELPIGAAKIPDGASGALISTLIFLNLDNSFHQVRHITLTISILVGIAAAYLGGEFISDKRRFNIRYMNLAGSYASAGKIKSLENMFFFGLAEQFLSSAVFTGAIYAAGYFMVKWTVPAIPPYWDGLFAYMNASLWGLLAAVMINQFFHRKTFPATIAGIIAGTALVVFL